MKSARVGMLPEFLEPEDLLQSAAVVIDVLRASTTIVQALANGANIVWPCLTPDEARTVAERGAPDTVLLGGERHGQLIPGFDLDNSPFSYTREQVAGREIAFTTTNGTKALLASRAAQEVLVGAFVNRAAIVHHLVEHHQNVVLVCAGTDGHLTAEDILFAGAVVHDLVAARPAWEPVGVQARMALDYFLARSRDPESFRAAFLGGRGARNLTELGYHRDLEFAQQNDLFTIVPRFDPTTGGIRPVNSRSADSD